MNWKGMIKSLEIKLKGTEGADLEIDLIEVRAVSLFSAPMRNLFLVSVPSWRLLRRSGQRRKLYELSVRASKINPQAKEHPKLNFTFAEVKGKNQISARFSRHSCPVP